MSLYYLMTSEHYKWQYIVFYITQTINFEVYIDSNVSEGRDMLHYTTQLMFMDASGVGLGLKDLNGCL